MADLTNFAEDAIANTFRGIAFSTPTYLALFTTPTDETGGGTEVTDAGYSRLLVSFDPPVGGVISNPSPLTFGAAVGSYLVSHIAIMDAATAGNMLLQKELVSPIIVVSGSAFDIQAGNLTFTVL